MSGYDPLRGNLSTEAPIGQLQSMTIKMLIGSIVTILIGAGVHLGVNWQDDVYQQKMADAIFVLVSLIFQALAWYGRVRATKVVQPGATGVNTTAKLIIAACLLSGGGLVFVGCTTGQGQFHIQPTTPAGLALDAHTYYDTIVSGVTRARKAGTLSAEDFAKFKTQAHEVYNIILELDAVAADGETPTWKDAYGRYQKALTKLTEWLTKVAPPEPQPQAIIMGWASLLMLLSWAVENGPKVAEWVRRHKEGDTTVKEEINAQLAAAKAESDRVNDEMDKTT